MAVYPFTLVNRRGSAAIATTAVTVNTDNVVFTFQNHAFVNAWYRGTVFVDIAQKIPTGTTGRCPFCSRPMERHRPSPNSTERP